MIEWKIYLFYILPDTGGWSYVLLNTGLEKFDLTLLPTKQKGIY